MDPPTFNFSCTYVQNCYIINLCIEFWTSCILERSGSVIGKREDYSWPD